MNLKELKQKSPQELLTQAEDLGIDDASSMRVQDLMFAILKKVAGEDNTIYGEGVIEVLQEKSHNDISKYVCIRKRSRNRRSGKSDTWRK